MTLGLVKSVPNFCLFGLQRAEKQSVQRNFYPDSVMIWLTPPQVYTQVTFDGHTQTNTDAATDGVVPASAPASSVNPAAPSLNNGTALSTFASAVRGASSDGGRGEYVQESDKQELLTIVDLID